MPPEAGQDGLPSLLLKFEGVFPFRLEYDLDLGFLLSFFESDGGLSSIPHGVGQGMGWVHQGIGSPEIEGGAAVLGGHGGVELPPDPKIQGGLGAMPLGTGLVPGLYLRRGGIGLKDPFQGGFHLNPYGEFLSLVLPEELPLEFFLSEVEDVEDQGDG